MAWVRRVRTAWRLSLYGLRRGEVLGLRWSDIDLRTGTLTVVHASEEDLQRGQAVLARIHKIA